MTGSVALSYRRNNQHEYYPASRGFSKVDATLRYEIETNHCERPFAFLSCMRVHVTFTPNDKWHVPYMYSKADKFPPLKNFALRVHKRNHNFAALCFPVFLVPRFPLLPCSLVPLASLFSSAMQQTHPFPWLTGASFVFSPRGPGMAAALPSLFLNRALAPPRGLSPPCLSGGRAWYGTAPCGPITCWKKNVLKHTCFWKPNH